MHTLINMIHVYVYILINMTHIYINISINMIHIYVNISITMIRTYVYYLMYTSIYIYIPGIIERLGLEVSIYLSKDDISPEMVFSDFVSICASSSCEYF